MWWYIGGAIASLLAYICFCIGIYHDKGKLEINVYDIYGILFIVATSWLGFIILSLFTLHGWLKKKGTLIKFEKKCGGISEEE